MDKSAKLIACDISLQNEGSIWLLRGRSERGMEWIYENVEIQQLFGPSAVVEWRYVKPIAEGAREAGLQVSIW